MLTLRLIGALLVLCGLVWLAAGAILRGRMSDPAENPDDSVDRTLEPRQGGLGFLGLRPNLGGLALIAVGVLLLLLPVA